MDDVHKPREIFPVKFNGDQFDLNKFMRDHPGGVDTLKNYKGKSILHVMQKFGHSNSAYHMMNDLKVDGDHLKDVNLTGEVSENWRLITSEENTRNVEEIKFLEELEGKSILHVMQKFGHSNSAYHMMNDLKVDGDHLKDVNLTGEVSENWRLITSEENTRNVEEIKFLEELEARLDWSKPLLCQLKAIAPHYETWVNSAVYRKCRLFTSPLMESLTYTPWYLVPMFWIPIIIYLGFTQYIEQVACGDSCQQTPITNFQYVYHLGLGVLLWTALEYSLHRWVFHLNPGSSVTMIQIHFLIHGMHHKVPFDGLRQVFPPIPAFVLAASIYSILQPLLYLPVMKLTGALLGYLTYDMIHFYVHHGSPRDGTYLYAMKRYHSNHHFINPDKAFGISSNVWDHVFRTFVHVKKLGFSLHWYE